MLAQAALVELALRVLTLSRVCALLGIHLGVDGEAPVHAPPAPLSERERRRVALVHHVLAVVPWDGRCLRTSLLIGHLLRDRHPVLRLGVKPRDGALVFHAWLDIGGASVGEHALFQPLSPHDRATADPVTGRRRPS